MWVIVVLASLAAVLLFCLCVPFDMFLYADVHGKPSVRLRFSWLFGLVSKEITGKKEKPPQKKRVARAKKKFRREDIMMFFRILKTRGVMRHLKELIKDLFSSLNFRGLVADFKIGLGDPADTGLLFAIVGPATAIFGSSRFYRISLEPSFSDDAVLQGYSHGTVRIWPIRLITPVLKVVFSITAIRVARTLITSKWKGRKK